MADSEKSSLTTQQEAFLAVHTALKKEDKITVKQTVADKLHDILEILYSGQSIQHVFKNLFSGSTGNYAMKCFYELIDSDAELQKIYMRLQFVRAELYADEIPHIADTETDQIRARNRIDARKWYASKIQPHKYGDRIQVEHYTVNITEALNAAKQRVLPVRSRDAAIDAQVIESKLIECDAQQITDAVTPLQTGDASDKSSDQ